MLLTPEIKAQMLENGKRITGNHPPVVKLFSIFSNAKWLLTDLQPDEPDRAFGLCDLGMGFPEVGYVSISELEGVTMFGGVPAIERDEHWEAEYPLYVYAEAAQDEGEIIDDNDDPRLKRVAEKKLVKSQP